MLAERLWRRAEVPMATASQLPALERGLRILMVVSEAPPVNSGVARTIECLQRGLEERGHTVDFVAYPEVPRLVYGEMRLSAMALRLRSLVARLANYDVVHLHGSAPTFSDVVLLAMRLLGRRRPPLVYTHHADIDLQGVSPLCAAYNYLHRQLCATADEVVSTTNDYADLANLPLHTSVIPLGVDAARFAHGQAKDEQFTVLFVGQFRPYKGVPVLLRALAQVHGARLLLAGHGPQEQLYRDMAQRLGLDVEFHVRPSDVEVAQLYRRAHTIVLPSVTHAEAFGLVLLEGMAAGCVPVASDLPGVREVLGRIGFTFQAGNETRLAEVLRRLRDNPELGERISDRAQLRTASFSWRRTVDEYERVFQSLVAVRRLADSEPIEAASALGSFAESAAASFDGAQVDVLLADRQGALQIAASRGGGLNLLDQEGAQLVAEYCHATRESVLVGPDQAPRSLASLTWPTRGWTSAIAAPLCAPTGEAFGVLRVQSFQPFVDGDLTALTRLARHTSPVVHRLLQQQAPELLLARLAAEVPEAQPAAA